MEGYKYVLTKKHPDLFTANVPGPLIERHEKWVKAGEMASYYILATMSLILQHQLKDYLSATDIILSLKEIFGKQG